LQPVLDAIDDIEAGSGGTVGHVADSVTVTITQDCNPIPDADADVWITSNADGSTTITGTLQTDSGGEATFLLDARVTYYLWMQKDDYNSMLGEEFEAEADD
jgi:hypothetical protein